MVVATQNPVEIQGTYPPPEAQRDRFTACIAMGYPTRAAEQAMLDHHVAEDPIDRIVAVTNGDEVQAAAGIIRQIFVHASLKQYIVGPPRSDGLMLAFAWGLSPRAGLQWARATKALAAMSGRGYVIPEDIASLAVPALAPAHPEHRRQHPTATSEVVADILARVPRPRRG